MAIALVVSVSAGAEPLERCGIGVGDPASCRRYYEDTHGPLPFIVIFLRFNDVPDTPQCDSPHTDCWDYFREAFRSTYPGMDNYWQEVSYGAVDLAGSHVLEQWYDLPGDQDDYTVDGVDCIDRLAKDGAAVADADVNFNDYAGIVLVLNGALYSNRGRKCEMTLDGTTRTWHVAFLFNYGLDVVAHEIGHSLAMPWHSCVDGSSYGSRWDVVSNVGNCQNPDTVFRCVPVHPIAFHKWQSGWIPNNRRFTVPNGTTRIITLERTAQPPPTGYLMGRIPIGSSSKHYYTIEARKAVSYDVEIPGEAVLIHEANENLHPQSCDARVVDGDDNGNVNDDGAMWLPGETYLDSTNNVMVSVLGEGSTGWSVGLSTAPQSPCYVDASGAGTEDGSAAHPFDTVLEGVAAVVPAGTVEIRPGHYPERITIRKPCTLHREGAAGLVSIGM